MPGEILAFRSVAWETSAVDHRHPICLNSPAEPWWFTHNTARGRWRNAVRSVIERFLEYVRSDTHSAQPAPGEEQLHPSTPAQVAFAGRLQQELLRMGSHQIIHLDDGSFLVCFSPTEGHENAPHVVFASHVDTYFGCPGGANPITHAYKGGDIALPKDGVVIPAADLKGLEGKRIITADGTTLLGGDDKAGVAALMTLIENIMESDIPHGPLTVWFCTDEEIGEVGVKFLPKGVAKTWDIFWTVDGERLNVVDVGCFFGAKVNVEFVGNDTHPGVSGRNLKPAHYAAGRFLDKLADGPSPWTTGGDESFIYVPSLPAGSASKVSLTVYPRTFHKDEFPAMEEIIRCAAEEAADRFGVKATVSETEIMYVSTEVAIDSNRRLLQSGLAALRGFGVELELHRVRAGTDGAMLNMTYPSIPAPNLGTGARNLHGLREFVVADELELVPGILRSMLGRYALLTR